MEIYEKRLEEIHPYERNPRKNEQAVEAVANSIREFGFKVPIVIDRDGTIVAGHTRYKAAQRLGLKAVPCIVADDLTPEQVKAFRLADNKTGELAEWDFPLLEKELEGITIGMEGFGFDLDAIAEEASRIEDEATEVREDDFDPDEMDEGEEPVTEEGDLWIMGDHVLLCGDATKREDIARLMDAESEGGVLSGEADLVVTDPPYNVAYEGGTEDALTIRNDSMDKASFEAFLSDSFAAMSSRLKPGGAFYVWHASFTQNEFWRALERSGLLVKQQLIWVKSQFVLGRQDYQWQHEPCFYGWKKGAGHWFKDSRLETTVLEDAPNIAKMSKEELRDYVRDLMDRLPSTTVIREDKPTRSAEHPTMKPIRLFGYLIKNSSQRGQTVLDPFCGSGTTVIACEQLGRKARVLELDPRYCDVIVRRWEEFTGRKATRVTMEGGEHIERG